MFQQEQSRWQTIGRRVQWAVVIAIVLVVVFLLIRLGYAYQWTGFGPSQVKGAAQPSKTLWDWLDLLIIPAVLAGGGLWFNRQQRAQETQAADERAQDEAVHAYLDQMGQLLLDKDRPLRQSKEVSEARTLARARTLTVMIRLNPRRRQHVLHFLTMADLVCRVDNTDPVLSLKTVDLSGVNMVDVPLAGADLSLANLSGADLSGANLRGVRNWTDVQLSAARSLKGATMPNGKEYREWLNDKEDRGRGVVSADGPLEITDVFGRPFEACALRSVKTEGVSSRSPDFRRTPRTQISYPANQESCRRARNAKLSGRRGTQRADPTLCDLGSNQSEPPPSLSPGPGQGSKESPSAGTQRS